MAGLPMYLWNTLSDSYSSKRSNRKSVQKYAFSHASSIITKKSQKISGMTLLEIMIVFAIMGILLMIAVPGWLRQREQSRGVACQENLTKIEYAKEMYTFDNNLRKGATIEITDLYNSGDNQGYLKKEPDCPGGGEYSANPVDSDPTCSYYGSELFDSSAKHALP
jgi:prepilin-type N-terminal cleavage/methylation domain-containing protein